MRGTALAGHARALSRVARGCWEASCKCGWSTTRPTHQAAKDAYSGHRANAVPICKCGVELTDSNRAKRSPHSCKACVTARVKNWAGDHPDRWERQKRHSHLRKKYGLTAEAYDALLADQGGGCAICQSPIADKRGFRPHVDHCHDSGKVRGILCGHCNMGLGHFGDDSDRIRKALEYLEKSN